MDRTSTFVRGLLAGAGLMVAGFFGMAAWASCVRVAQTRRRMAGPNYAYLR